MEVKDGKEIEFKRYIGTKVLDASPMTRGEYNKFRGWTISGNEDPKEDGYLVKYEDGYTSWSPENVFNQAYRHFDGMTFGGAIECLKKGFKVARAGWNGKGMYLWLLPATSVQKDWVKDQRLLECFKEGEDTLNCLGSIRMKTATGEVLTGWLASQTDILAEDWMWVE